MKKLLVILQYELTTYLKNKGFMITTLLIAIVGSIILFLPRFIDMSDFLGINKDDTEEVTSEYEDKTFVLFDKTGIIKESGMLDTFFPKADWEYADTKEALKDKVEENTGKSGFIVNSLTDFEYVVFNSEMYESDGQVFNQLLTVVNQYKYCQDNGIDYAVISEAFNPSINFETTVLGKDMSDNYWYCYILVMVVFMIIILYGVMVATSVTQEKSNRTIELLVTSADTNCLFFGKVLAGTIAALIQVGIILIAVLGSYNLNREYWGKKFDFLLNIPADVLLTFIVFGLLGLLLYTFVYGALGALVSKTEDINKSAGSVQMVVMIVYFLVMFQLTNIDGTVMKVLSFLPVSSYSAMYARVAMGTVAGWEIAVSLVILIISILFVGIIGSKIYRMGTLLYGNPIKLSNALKMIKKDK